MNNFLEDLKKYFENTPRSKVLEDWAKTEEFDQCGVLVSDFLEQYMFSQKETSEVNGIITSQYSPNFNSGFFIYNIKH